MGNELIPYADVERMGVMIAKSGLFGMKTPESAIALMLIAQAEGMHPAMAARDYDVIQNRPALKAKAKLARFQRAGGVFRWIERDDARVSAEFSHPSCPKPLVVTWDMARATTAGLGGKDNWKKYPRQMLSARVISEGVDAVYPDAGGLMYVPEEVQDFDDKPKAREIPAEVVDAAPKTQAAAPAMTHEEFIAPIPPATPREPGQDEFDDALDRGTPAPATTDQGGDDRLISDPQAKRLFAIMKSAGKTIEEVKAIVGVFGYSNSRDIKRRDYAAICSEVEKPKT